MGIGEKIKEYRTKCDMTQKDLADRLHVTNQAVSRWENDEAEPSFDTLRMMAGIFGCTINDLFDMETKAPEPIHEVKIVERILPQETKPMLAVCENCNKPIYEMSDICRFDRVVSHGRTSTTREYLYCSDCYEKYLAEKKREAAQKRALEIAALKKRRLRSFVWPSIIFAILLAIAVSFFGKGDSQTGAFYLATAFLAFTFSACLFLNNNFIEDLWFGIASWGFVRLPGVIMEFSLGGVIVGFLIKIILWIFGILLAVLTVFLATAVGLVLSIFAYPFAIAKNFKEAK